MTTETPPVLQLRLVIEAADFDAAVAFYRDALGLPEQAAFEGDGDARVAILEAGRATLEIVNPAQRRLIDEVEAGRDQHGVPRVAVEVADTRGTVERLEAAGASVIGAPAETPWRSLNARLAGPAGVQVTVFQELTTLEDRASGEGFGTAAERGA
jgi:catechol 2,3-dioxygenase-like lactoylglutathione lyase family enzyme